MITWDDDRWGICMGWTLFPANLSIHEQLPQTKHEVVIVEKFAFSALSVAWWLTRLTNSAGSWRRWRLIASPTTTQSWGDTPRVISYLYTQFTALRCLQLLPFLAHFTVPIRRKHFHSHWQEISLSCFEMFSGNAENDPSEQIATSKVSPQPQRSETFHKASWEKSRFPCALLGSLEPAVFPFLVDVHNVTDLQLQLNVAVWGVGGNASVPVGGRWIIWRTTVINILNAVIFLLHLYCFNLSKKLKCEPRFNDLIL